MTADGLAQLGGEPGLVEPEGNPRHPRSDRQAGPRV